MGGPRVDHLANIGKKNNVPYVYNGIDRVDNHKGYTLDNCVACCRDCNISKGTKTASEFFNWLERAYVYYKGNL